jgi:uncharacterized protein (TIGR03382 family)
MRLARLTLIVCVTAALPAVARPAHACGGLFCSIAQQIPIDQSGEQIVFSIDDEGVTAHILIQYQGSARDFAWVVPVAVKPEISLGTQQLFVALLRATQPAFMLDTSALGCSGRKAFPPAFGATPMSGAAASGGGVQVLEERAVGPYDTVVLQSSNAAELVQWLADNGYYQPPDATPLITHYVEQGMLFVALKLQQDATTGEIQPLVLRMLKQEEACIPLILTRVAAVPDMTVQAFVLGKSRATPRNWFQVEVNQALIDWPNAGSNYKQLVTQAIDEAAGHGFVTEYAGSSSRLAGVLFTEGRFDLDSVRRSADGRTLIVTLFGQGLLSNQVVQALLRRYVPLPQTLRDRGVSEMSFYSPFAYPAELGAIPVDGVAFAGELEQRVVAPLRQAQQMLDGQPYLTRLYSTVSPKEMTRDPLFHFNPDLPSVSNVHNAKAVGGTCRDDGTVANLVVELPTGERIGGPASRGLPTWLPQRVPPAASRIELVGPSGAPTVYSSAQAQLVDQALDRETAEAVRMRPAPVVVRATGGGCSAAGGHAPAPLAALAVLVVALGGRRRTRARL